MLGFMVAAYAVFARAITPEHRWKVWLIGLLALYSVWVAFVEMTTHVFSLSNLLFFGLSWLASGGVTLYLYIRHTSPAQEGAG